jgi:hypothetical protein
MSTATLGPTTGAQRAEAKLAGWTVFAGAVLIVAGGLNVINGFTALEHSSYFTSQIVYSNLSFWGWMFLIWGGAEIVAGALVFARNPVGNLIGVALAVTAAILWFFMIFAAPWAAILGVTVSLLVIHGLTVGARRAEY